ncbi:MAG: hypothetical protein AB1696_18170 [Planctomycetota bacterium]
MKAGWVIAFVVVIVGSAAAALLWPHIQGMDTQFGKIQFGQPKAQEEAKKKEAKPAEEKPSKEQQGVLLVEEGKKAEMKEDWAAAIKKYTEARKLWPVESLKMRLLAAKAVEEALDHTKQGRVGDALARYDACKEHIHNKAFVEHKMKGLKEYETEYQKGVTSCKAGRLREAIPFFVNAKSLAAKEGFRSNADQLCREMESQLRKEKEGVQAVESVLNAAAARGDWFVVVALCRGYRGDATLSGLHDALAAHESKARGSIAGNPAEFPALRMDETLKLQTIHLKDDKADPVIGRIVDEGDIAVKIAVEKDGKTVNRMILKNKIDRIERETDIRSLNRARAIALLGRAATQAQNKNAEGLLRIAGQVYHEFSDLDVADNAKVQIEAAGLPEGLDALVAKATADLTTKAVAKGKPDKENKAGAMGTVDPVTVETEKHKEQIDAAINKNKEVKPKQKRTTERVIFN